MNTKLLLQFVQITESVPRWYLKGSYYAFLSSKYDTTIPYSLCSYESAPWTLRYERGCVIRANKSLYVVRDVSVFIVWHKFPNFFHRGDEIRRISRRKKDTSREVRFNPRSVRWQLRNHVHLHQEVENSIELTSIFDPLRLWQCVRRLVNLEIDLSFLKEKLTFHSTNIQDATSHVERTYHIKSFLISNYE